MKASSLPGFCHALAATHHLVSRSLYACSGHIRDFFALSQFKCWHDRTGGCLLSTWDEPDGCRVPRVRTHCWQAGRGSENNNFYPRSRFLNRCRIYCSFPHNAVVWSRFRTGRRLGQGEICACLLSADRWFSKLPLRHSRRLQT